MAANHCLLAAALCAAAGLAVAQEQQKSCCEAKKAAPAEALTHRVQVMPAAPAPLAPLATPAPLAARAPLAVLARPVQAEVEAGRAAMALRAAQPEARTRSRTVMVHSENGREFKVEIEGDEIRAWIDGEELPRERVKVSNKRVVLKDEDGKTAHQFDRAVTLSAPGVKLAPGQEFVVEGLEMEDPIVWGAADEFGAWAPGQPAGDHPPVMIGINMGPLSEDEADEEAMELLGEHDLGAEDVVVVMGVIEGLPASDAGVEEGDVLVAIDGEWGVTAESLRDVLMEKEPGDSIEIVVIRGGDEEEIELELAPYDPGRLGQPFADEAPTEVTPFTFEWGAEHENVQKLLEKLNSQRGELDGEVRELVERLQREELGRFRQLDEMPRFRVYREDGQAPRALVTPVPPVPHGSPYGDAMHEHQDRLERIEDRLERIEDRLDRLLEALESREQPGR
ncbi:MAG TPA: PDZ domain-containing protein [Phycisphaerales bacterium]|nr:PDZ domain-containing protein [Phycisphaerales bacterium]